VLLFALGGLAALVIAAVILALVAFTAYAVWTVVSHLWRSPRQFPIAMRMAFQNFIASRLKTLLIGLIVAGGATLIVVGSSFIGSITTAMSRSIIGSAAGDIQVAGSSGTASYENVSGVQPQVPSERGRSDLMLALIHERKRGRGPELRQRLPRSGVRVPFGRRLLAARAASP
jgi:hypothetical protein